MNSEAGWTPERLGRLTLDQLACLTNKDAPGSAPVTRSAADLVAALEEIDREDRDWYA
jgi:hypothetical protein